MKRYFTTLLFALATVLSFAQGNNPANGLNVDNSKIGQEIIALSRKKWQWMADKNADSLAVLFDAKSVFVHMGGSWGKEREVNIIREGFIHYKKADIHEVPSVSIFNETAVLLNRITLLAVVGGNEVSNPFMVTEVYVKEKGKWKMTVLAFSKLMVPGEQQK